MTSEAEVQAHASAGVAADRLVAVPNAIARPAVSTPAAEVRRALGLGEGDRLVVTASRLSPQKGLGELVEAVGILRRSAPTVVLAIAGDGPMRPRLEAAAAGSPGSIRMLGHVEGIGDLLAAADVCAFPSHAESYGRAALEAMLVERPVLLSTIRPWTDWFEDREEACFAPVGDASAIAARLSWLLADPLRARSIARAGFAAAGRRTGGNAAVEALDRIHALARGRKWGVA